MCMMIWKRSLVPWTLVISSGGWFQSQKTLMAAAQSALDFSFEWWRGRRARQQEHEAALCFTLHHTTMLVTFTKCIHQCIHSKSWPKGHDLPWLPGPVLLKLYWSGYFASMQDSLSTSPRGTFHSYKVINKHDDWCLKKKKKESYYTF